MSREQELRLSMGHFWTPMRSGRVLRLEVRRSRYAMHVDVDGGKEKEKRGIKKPCSVLFEKVKEAVQVARKVFRGNRRELNK